MFISDVPACANVLQHEIIVGDAVPVKQKYQLIRKEGENMVLLKLVHTWRPLRFLVDLLKGSWQVPLTVTFLLL